MNGIIQKLKSLSFPEAILIISSFSYLIGFIVVNSFLSELKFSTNEIISSKYISAGIITIAFTFPIFYFSKTIYKEFVAITKPEKTFRRINQYISLVLTILTYPYGFIILLSLHLIKSESHTQVYFTHFFSRVIDAINQRMPSILIVPIMIGIFMAIIAIYTYLKNLEWKISSTKLFDWLYLFLRIIISTFFLSLIAALVFTAFIPVAKISLQEQIVSDSNLPLLDIYTWYVVYGLIFTIIIYYYNNPNLVLEQIKTSPYIIYSIFITAILSCIITFGKTVYPFIKSEYGGGMAQAVVLYPKIDNQQSEIKSLTYSNNHLVSEDQTYLFLLSENDSKEIRTLKIKKDVIEIIKLK